MDDMSQVSTVRIRRLTYMGIIIFLVLASTSIMTGYMIHREIMGTYSENYIMLESAGFSELLAAPQVVSQRVLFLVTIFPFLGAGIIFPILYKCACEIRSLTKELSDFIHKNV